MIDAPSVRGTGSIITGYSVPIQTGTVWSALPVKSWIHFSWELDFPLSPNLFITFYGLRFPAILFADDAVLLAPPSCDFPVFSGQFLQQCDAVGESRPATPSRVGSSVQARLWIQQAEMRFLHRVGEKFSLIVVLLLLDIKKSNQGI